MHAVSSEHQNGETFSKRQLTKLRLKAPWNKQLFCFIHILNLVIKCVSDTKIRYWQLSKIYKTNLDNIVQILPMKCPSSKFHHTRLCFFHEIIILWSLNINISSLKIFYLYLRTVLCILWQFLLQRFFFFLLKPLFLMNEIIHCQCSTLKQQDMILWILTKLIVIYKSKQYRHLLQYWFSICL